MFWGLTFVANLFIIFSSSIFWLIEKEENLKIHSYLDALWWAFCTVTTVGYGDIVPVTQNGRIWGILTMLIGTAFFASFTGIFAHSYIQTEMDLFEGQMGEVGKIEKQEARKLAQIESELKEIKSLLKSR